MIIMKTTRQRVILNKGKLLKRMKNMKSEFFYREREEKVESYANASTLLRVG